MSFPWNRRTLSSKLVVASACCSVAFMAHVALADSAFVDQIPSGVTTDPANLNSLVTLHSTAMPSFSPTPQFAAPHPNANLAATIEIGNGNHVLQMQDGTGDQSNVDIIGGSNNNVGVVQAGNNLQSNLLLIGTQGISIGVIQPNHSAPVNMAVIHVPSGTVIIPHL